MSVVKDIVDMHVKSERCLQHLLRFLNSAPPSQEVLLYKNEDFEILNHLGKIGIFKSDTGVRKDVWVYDLTIQSLCYINNIL